ncbi:hypothetical protein TWF106_006963 [Orbilia oligospora]|uniref:Uncharacterized protein n=1 Tax=Orbilia oligospora TaxID=2813651 RepID=A0A6G1MMY5_ORBOL|nr:hypothetical protein TWF191_010756 [Orbilia oligospora]KAF3219812.1 hypothetical protein TWF106_006963 [Orbilia oligospora]KAF3221352.1 hypothetical protein TWF679_008042 [Orbilia oligospora]KAF3262581.1 hypothetical protein TWF192_007249 [Orbilia oligospora]
MKTFTWQFLWFLLLLVAVEAGSCPESAVKACERFCSVKGCVKLNPVNPKKCTCRCSCKAKKNADKD